MIFCLDLGFDDFPDGEMEDCDGEGRGPCILETISCDHAFCF